MRLLILSNLYPPYIIGGNEILARDVVEELRARGHQALVLTGRGQKLENREGTLGLLDLNLDRKDEIFLGPRPNNPLELFQRYLFNCENYAVTKKIINSWEPDVVIAWNLSMLSTAPLIAARRTPTVIHVCDKVPLYMLKDLGMALRPSAFWKRFLLQLVKGGIQPLLYRLAHPKIMVTVSRFMRDVYIKAGFPEEIFRVLHLGVPADLFSPAPRSRGDDIVKFLYVGQLWEGKGPQVAIRALGYLVHCLGMARVHLDICGEGRQEFKEHFKKQVEEEKVGGHISFLGSLGRGEVARLYQSSDILLFPSIWEEPFAAVPIEAMACGMAVIATSIGGTSEAINHEETGLLVSPNDPVAMAEAMRRLVDDDELRLKLGSQAAAVARDHFSFEAYVDRLEAIYRESIGDVRSR